MPVYRVTVRLTRTIYETQETEVHAADEDEAEDKAIREKWYMEDAVSPDEVEVRHVDCIDPETP